MKTLKTAKILTLAALCLALAPTASANPDCVDLGGTGETAVVLPGTSEVFGVSVHQDARPPSDDVSTGVMVDLVCLTQAIKDAIG